jgi:hypothetical protein
MSDTLVIPMIRYNGLPYVFLPLEGQADDTVDLVCTAEDFHWRCHPSAIAEQWPELLAQMRAHQASHA